MKNSTTTQIIAKEGWKYILFLTVLFVLSIFVDFFSWVFFALVIISIYVFRNPERLPLEDDDMAILSPCDGDVISISKDLQSDGTEYLKVAIRKSLLEVSILRSPTKINIKETKRRHGLCLPTNTELGKKLGEKAILTCSSGYSDIRMEIKAGMFARNIALFKTVGPLKSAQRFGLLLDGCIELYLPLDSRVKVAVGDSLKAGESVLGYFAHKGNINEN